MKQTAPLSKSQYGLYVECVAHQGEICYNISYIYVLDGSLDEEKLKTAIETTVAAHPTLFTRIELNEQGEPMQTIDDSETFRLEIEHITDIEAEKQGMVMPFDLYNDRLFRIRLLKDAEHFYFFIDIHHIIADGSALKVILADMEAAYNSKTLEPETMTLADVAKAEAEKRKTPVFEEDKQWYAQHFDCGDCYSPLLPDKDETESQQGRMTRTMNVDNVRLDAFCKEHGIFKSTFFTAVYSYLLAKFNNEQEALFNTIYSGRSDERLAHTVAMLVKTLPVYATFTDNTTVLEFLKAEQEQMTGCRQHDSYAFSDMVSDLNLQIASFFAWHGNVLDNMEISGKPMKAIQMCNTTLEVPFYVKALIIDDHYCVEAEYKANVYSEQLISQFLESYEAVVEGFLTEEYLRNINIATKRQVELLDSFNDTDKPYDDTQTVVSLFRRQAKATPDAEAVVFKDHRYSYAEVDDISDRIASYIVSRGLGIGDAVSVIIPRCEWMAIASLGVLKAGCAYQPLDPSYPKERLNFMVKDADAKLLIADEELRDLVDEYQGEVLLTKEFLQLPSLTAETNSKFSTLNSKLSPSDRFILLYTSGSTGVPKGCQLTHGNLVNYCNWYWKYYELKPEHNVAEYASYGFDVHQEGIYPPLTAGATVHIIPEELRLDLVSLNEYLEREHITHTFMTTQVGYQFATNIDNHSLLHLSVAGEKLASIAPPQGYQLHNGYGPTEATILITIYPVTKKDKDVPIGKPLDNVRLYVVDQQGHRLPVGAMGELWASGPQVALGYLNWPDKNAEVFVQNPFTTEEKYMRTYRTGDIVRYLPDGNIQFVGRRDGQVKIRGFRIELKEVESVIRQFPGIKDATVQAFDDEGGGKFIAAYIVADEQIDIEAMNNFILEEKPPYMVPAVTMQIDSIPLNQNQKVNKKALPKPEKKAAEAVMENNVPMNEMEKELHELIAGIVNTTDFGVTTKLSYVGLTSISAIKLAVQVNKHYGVTLDSKALVKSGTLQSIENVIWKSIQNSEYKIQNPKSKSESNNDQSSIISYPLSYAQTGVYIDCVSNPTSTLYNIPFLLNFPAGIDAAKLAEAVKRVVEAHPELGVHFTTEGDTVVQTLADSVPVEVPMTEMSDQQLAAYKQEFVRPFELQKPPLYRFEVVKTESGVKLLMDVHHLVFDGSSADLFIHQIISVLENSAVDKENYTYFDFVSDQQKDADSDAFKAAQQFFAEKLQNCEGASEIPADLPKTDQQGFIGEAVCPINHEKAEAFCRQQEITPAHLFLAATSYVVSRYTNNREVYLNTISSGRSNLKIADTVGMFVNTLALGLSIDDVTVCEYLRQVGETFDETLHHENYPFARIASDFSFHPAIFYAYQVGVLSDYKLGGQAIAQETLELNVPKFKINIKIEARGVVVQYDDSLYSAQLGNALAESIAAVAERMMEEPQSKIRQLPIVGKKQEEELSHLRQVATGEAPFKFFHECIAHFAGKCPEQEALVACDATYSYKEMDELTNRIANGLRQRGVESSDRIALLLPRTSWLILSLFGVMKAGAAYIPCDPDYPEDRIKLILEDSEARFIITSKDRLNTVPSDKAIDVEELVNCQLSTVDCQLSITPDDLAYLIYTSGSTGRPKGVMLRHEGICNYLSGHPGNVFANAVLTDATRILSVTTISFDAALQDIGTAYYNGKTLILATEEQANNPLELAQLIKEQHIDMVSGTPSRWQTWLTSNDFCQAIGGVKICRAGGEKYPQQLLDKLRSVTKARLFNCYGPTEITVASNNAELTNASLITVGKPQLNVKEFIVDADGNELPVGVVGELYIGGKGVARGYNKLDEMTRERFVEYRGERIYKSGDYAKWLPDGNVVILGRTDHQIKLRGLRIELGEVENAILQVDGVKQVVVTIRQIGGMEHLCAYFTADQKLDTEAMRTTISSHLTDYMVPTAYMQLDRLPMTPNGKTDIKALPDPTVQTAQGGSGAGTSRKLTRIERELQDMVKEILGIEDVDIECSLGMVGLTSLSAIRLAILIQQRYGVSLQAKQMVKNSSLMSIEDEIISSKFTIQNSQSETQEEKDADNSALSMDHCPLSYAQTGVYFDCLKNPMAIQYNIPQMVTFAKDTDTDALSEAIRTVVGKHPQMTAHFGQTEEGIVQTLNPELTIDIPVKTMSEKELGQYKHAFVCPFDLASGPLCRFEIVTTEQATYLLFDVHHLVFDGGSTDIFFRQLCALLNGTPIEDEIISYPAYVMAEKAAEDSEDYQAAKDFFKERLSVVEAATGVRPDLPKPVVGTVSQAVAPLDFDNIQSQLSSLNAQLSTIITPAHLTLSAVYYALSRFANSEQVCITTVSNGRSDLRIRNTVGMFVNTLAMSATIGKQSVRNFLQEVSENFDETLSHENYPFAQIAADYGLTPEIQFVYQLGVASQHIVGGTPLKMEGLGTQTPKFPITFFIAPVDGQPSVCVAYDNGKYSARLMQSLADAVKVTVERMLEKPDATLSSICMVSDEEAERIIKIGTGKDIEVDITKTFADLFTEQAKRTPDAPAVVDRDSQLTYGEMDRYSNALAHQLIDFGVQPNDFVCVMLDRKKEFPLSVLAIHKAGAAYTPLDFEYPNERLSYMLENSESKVLITSHDVLKAKQAEGDFNTAAAKTFFIDDFMAESLSKGSNENATPIDLSTPDGLAYMIYTSGSTGKPKGAMLHQAGLRNFIAVVIDMEKLTAADRVSGHRSFSFDAHIEDMYPVLTLGGSFHIMPTEIRKDLAAIRQFLIDHQCTGGGYSTAMTCLLLNTFDDLPIRFTTGGGEKMDGVFSDHIEIINVYGPTECTNDTSYYSIAPGRRVENIPIGQSVANNWNFIVDTAGNLVPQGVAGELCFAGIQVGRGYWRLPERTAKSFVDCPFVKEDRWGRPVRMYRTGDLCRWNEEGQIEYMGRIDTQVKLRGFRIELGEIESKVLNIEGIRQAAAEVRKVMGNEHLVLYYTLEEGSALTDEDIRKTLAASSLAEYMVPDAYMRMDAMPMTPNGKINRKVLPAPEMKRATAFEAPKGEKEELFCSIFSNILNIKEVGATDNFFEIGGTSINAIKVIVEASKHGVQIVFNDIFNLKTPRALAAFVEDQSGNAEPRKADTAEKTITDTPEAAQYAPLNALLTTNNIETFRNGKRQPIGDVLLTGATGYLGIHILHELLTNYDCHILCPLRGEPESNPMHRLKTLHYYYFGETEVFDHIEERVETFAAEVTQPDALNAIDKKGLTVINCVANVKHFSAGNDIEMVNIESVRHLISFCLRTDSRLIHISTSSVAGLSIDDVPGPEVKLTEQDFYIGQHVSDRKYTYSKFKAEELVLDAVAHHGLNAKIMRVGNLSARQKDGEFQINFNTNNFLALLRAFVVIGMVPYEKLDLRFEFSPIDEVAHAIMLLSQTPKDCVVFHPYNTHRQFLSDILTGFAEAGITLKRVENDEFQQALEKMMDNPDLVTLVRPLMAYNLGGNRKVRSIESTNDYTTQVLYRLGFQWPTTAADYVHRFVDTIVGFDFFNV
ncbi:MAG: amino acid adenylation domain-containing protein [Bacteroidales bacterium]|nr:amino acid adenylation domain-containing protein [Bacteroidales bacterium]